jgi:hypothetical protein
VSAVQLQVYVPVTHRHHRWGLITHDKCLLQVMVAGCITCSAERGAVDCCGLLHYMACTGRLHVYIETCQHSPFKGRMGAPIEPASCTSCSFDIRWCTLPFYFSLMSQRPTTRFVYSECSTHMRLMSKGSVLDAVRGIGSSVSIPARFQHLTVNLVLACRICRLTDPRCLLLANQRWARQYR